MSAASERRLQAGDRIRMVYMPDDPAPIEPGDLGTVTDYAPPFAQDGRWTYGVKWDSGRTLSVIDGIDQFEKIS